MDFLITGPQHSGETWLATRLQRHPRIKFLPRTPAYERPDRKISPIQECLHKMAHPGEDAGSRVLVGDLGSACSLATGPEIEQLLAGLPRLRILLVLRSPLERAWLAVADALRIAQMVPEEASDQWLRDFMDSAHQRAQNDMTNMLSTWLTWAPEGRLRVMLHDAMVATPADILDDTYRFLGLDSSLAPIASKGPDRAGDLARIQAVYRESVAHLAAQDLDAVVRAVEAALGCRLPRWRETRVLG